MSMLDPHDATDPKFWFGITYPFLAGFKISHVYWNLFGDALLYDANTPDWMKY